jgi:protein SCO1
MSSYSRTVQWAVWGMLLAVMAVIVAAFLRSQLTGPAQPLPVYSEVAPFQLTDQFGETVSSADLRGHVWVADVIFTRCPGPCAQMTARLREIQDALPARSPVKLVSLTTDPEFDTPAVLKQYAERAGAKPSRWHFLTGTKHEIYEAAVNGLKLTSLEKPPPDRASDFDLFIHSTIFVLVDQHGRIRGTFNMLGEPEDLADARELAAHARETKTRLLQAIHQLLREK